MQCVIETDTYVKALKEEGVSEDERHRITVFLSENPESGDLIPGTGGARKLRFPFKGKGKSGGIRVITFYAASDVPVFLLDMFAKGTRVNLSQRERNELRDILSSMAESYRQTMRDKIAEIARSKA